MKKPSAFNEVKPRTPKGEARQRERNVTREIEDLLQLDDEEDFRKRLAESYGITPGSVKYDQIIAVWREYQRGKP